MIIKNEDIEAMLGFLLPESGAIEQTTIETASLLTSSKMRFAFRRRILHRLFKKIYENLSAPYKTSDWKWQIELNDIRNCLCTLRHDSWPKGFKVAFENWREELSFGIISPSIAVPEKYKLGAEILLDATREKINKFMNSDPRKIVSNWSISPHWPAWAAYTHIVASEGIPKDDLIYSDFLINENEHAIRIAKYMELSLSVILQYFKNNAE